MRFKKKKEGEKKGVVEVNPNLPIKLGKLTGQCRYRIIERGYQTTTQMGIFNEVNSSVNLFP